jgi:very-short-patch-repair endonuclease
LRKITWGSGGSSARLQFDVGDRVGWIGRVDFAYPEARLLIELDSHRHHSAMLDRQADEARDRRLRAAGWRVERFGWDDVTDPDRLITLLRGLLLNSGDGPTGSDLSNRHQLAG